MTPQHVEVLPPTSAGTPIPTEIAHAPQIVTADRPLRVEGQGLDQLERAALLDQNGAAIELKDSVGSSLQKIYLPDTGTHIPKGIFRFTAWDASGKQFQAPTLSQNPQLKISGPAISTRGQRGDLSVTCDIAATVALSGGEPNITLAQHVVDVQPNTPAKVPFTAREVGPYSVRVRALNPEEAPALASAPRVDVRYEPVQARFDAQKNQTLVTAPVRVVDSAGRAVPHIPVDMALSTPQGTKYARLTTDSSGRAAFSDTFAGQLLSSAISAHVFRVLQRVWKMPPEPPKKPDQAKAGEGEPKKPGEQTPVTPGPPTTQEKPPQKPPPTKPITEPPAPIGTTTTTHVKNCDLTSEVIGGPGITLDIISPPSGDSTNSENDPVPLIVNSTDIDQLIQTCTCRVDGQVKCTHTKAFDIADTVNYTWTLVSGKGKLLGAAGQSTLYQPPDLEIGKSDEAALLVEVKDSRGNDKPAKATFAVTTVRASKSEYKRTVTSKKETDPGKRVTPTSPACDCECQDPEWIVDPKLSAGEVEGPIKVCAGKRVILSFSADDSDMMHLKCRGTCGSGDKILPMVDETKYAWTATLGGFPDHGGNAGTNSHSTTAIYKAPDAGGEDTIKLTITDSGLQAGDPAQQRQFKVIAYKLDMVDKNGKVLNSPPTIKTEHVGVRTHLSAKLTPDDAGAKYQWIVGGDRIKTYEHRMDDPDRHKRIPLGAADLQAKSISFFWRDEGKEIPVTVTVTIGGFTCSKTVYFEVAKYTDMNYEVYTVDDDEDKSPGYDILKGHGEWHQGQDVNGETPAHSAPKWGDGTRRFELDYHGSAFLEWHQALIESHLRWRETFNVGKFIGPNPPPGADKLPKPEFLKLEPDSSKGQQSRVYNYVRLGEFQDLDELGRDVVHRWHNIGHGNIADATGFARMGGFSSPGAQEDTFWKWHSMIDEVRREWKPDKAKVVSVSPADKATVAAAPAVVTVAFDKPVSKNPGVGGANKIRITADKLTVNGSPAKGDVKDVVGTTKFMIYEFSGFDPPKEGEVTVELKGTASYEGKTYTFTYKKPEAKKEVKPEEKPKKP